MIVAKQLILCLIFPEDFSTLPRGPLQISAADLGAGTFFLGLAFISADNKLASLWASSFTITESRLGCGVK